MAGLLQLALDFLGVAPDAGAMPPSSRSRPRTGPRLPVRPDTAPSRPIRPRAGVLLPDAEGMTSLPRHPQANREALLMGRQVAYRLERGRRRTVGFTVGANGLAVRAPGWLPLPHIDAALVEKAEWILRKLADAEVRRDRQDAARIVWCDGAVFPLRGQVVTLRLGALRGAEGLRDDAETGVDKMALWLALAPDTEAVKIGEAVRSWIRREARADFTARLDRYAPLLGVQWARLSLTDARTRWGSASVSGAIRLHWRLMHFRPEVIDYVVVHELAHLRHMDHSPRFWAVVESMLPGYQVPRAELRADSSPKW
jgi:predicted metal-dependent hydrolase